MLIKIVLLAGVLTLAVVMAQVERNYEQAIWETAQQHRQQYHRTFVSGWTTCECRSTEDWKKTQ